MMALSNTERSSEKLMTVCSLIESFVVVLEFILIDIFYFVNSKFPVNKNIQFDFNPDVCFPHTGRPIADGIDIGSQTMRMNPMTNGKYLKKFLIIFRFLIKVISSFPLSGVRAEKKIIV